MASTGPAGRHVPPWSITGGLFELLWSRVTVLWRWRELTVPPAAIYVAGAKGGSQAALAAAGVVAVLVLAVALLRPRLLLNTPRRCVERSRASRWQRRWPAICRGLRWYRKLGEDGFL